MDVGSLKWFVWWPRLIWCGSSQVYLMYAIDNLMSTFKIINKDCQNLDVNWIPWSDIVLLKKS